MKEAKMTAKKLTLMSVFILIIVTILLSFMIGCSSQTPTSQTQAPASTDPQPTAVANATIELKFAHWSPPPSVFAKDVFDPWAKDIEERTNGRVKITMFPGGAMGAPPDHYNLLTSGMADIAMVDTSFTAGVFPLTGVMGLPMIFNNAKSAAASYYELIQKDLKDTEYKDVKVLFTGSPDPMHLYSAKKPIQTLEDLNGMKIAINSDIGIKALESLGAVGMFMGPPDIYTSLERGIIDAGAQCWEAGVSFKYHEVTKYRTVSDLGCSPHVVMMNLDKWNSLPDDIKKIIDDASGLNRSLMAGDAFAVAEKAALEQVIIPYDKSKGNPDIYYLPASEMQRWKDKMPPVYDYFVSSNAAKGLPAKQVYDDLVQIAQKYNSN
jgi:TRAP-type C4-dicarboxylate transport system substrate-binding protein